MAQDEAVPAAPVKRGIPGCFLWGCLSVGVLGLLFVGGCSAYLYMQKEAFEPRVDAFFAAYNAEDYEGMLGMVSQAWLDETPREEIGEFLRGVRGKLGAYQSRSMTGINAQMGFTVLDYSMEFETGPASGTIVITQKDEWLAPDGGFGIMKLNFKGPQFQN